MAADVRIATERRIKSLEHDLEVAEMRRKEQTLATRYHKIKFFGTLALLIHKRLLALNLWSRTTKGSSKNRSAEETNIRGVKEI